MNVVVTFGGYAPALAGAELMALRTAGALAAAGHQVLVLTDHTAWPTGTGGPATLREVPAAAGGPLPDLPWTPDLVHAFDLARPWGVALGLRLAGRYQVPLVLTPASAAAVWPDDRLGAEACAAAARILVLSPFEAGHLGLPHDPAGEPAGESTGESTSARVRVVGQGPGLVAGPRPPERRRRLPPSAGEGPITLFLGRRGRLKGLDVLVQAAPLVWNELPSAVFAVAGPSWDEPDDGGLPDDPRFVDLGVLDDQEKADALSDCALLCLPSRADVFPLVFVEAWTLGRPVVSGDFPGVHDVVRDGVDGLVCPVRPRDLASTLLTLLTGPARRRLMGEAGRRRAAEQLTWNAVARQVGSVYRELGPARVVR